MSLKLIIPFLIWEGMGKTFVVCTVVICRCIVYPTKAFFRRKAGALPNSLREENKITEWPCLRGKQGRKPRDLKGKIVQSPEKRRETKKKQQFRHQPTRNYTTNLPTPQR